MSFAAPQMLPWLGLVALVPILYLVRRRSRRAPVPHLFLWERALAAQGKSRRTRIHDIIGLIMNSLVVMALILAAAGPERATEVAASRPLLVVIDASLSMAARDRSGTDRATRARQLVTSRLAAWASEGPVSLALAAEAPRLLLPLGASGARFEETLAAPIDCRGRFDEAQLLDFVAEARTREPRLRVVLVSDGAFAGEAVRLAEAGVELELVAGAERNAAIVALGPVEREGAAFRVAVDIAVSGGPLAGSLVMSVPGGRGAEEAFDLPAGGRTSLELVGESSAACFVELALTAEGDALAADDRLEFKLERDPRLRLLVVAAEVGAHLESALAALDTVFDPAAAAKIAPEDWRRADLDRYDLVLMRGVTERSPLPPGAYILIDSYAPGLPFTAADPVTRPAILRQDRSRGILRGLDLRDLEVLRARKLRPEGAFEVLIESDAGPLLTRGETAEIRFVHLAFDCSEEASSLVLLPAFPLLVKDAAVGLVPPTGRSLPPAAAAGRPNELLAPPPGRAPRASLMEIAGEGKVVGFDHLLPEGRFLAPDRLGRASFRVGDREEELGLAVLDALSSDLDRRVDRAAPEADRPPRVRRKSPLGLPLLIAALALLLVEWLLYCRGYSR